MSFLTSRFIQVAFLSVILTTGSSAHPVEKTNQTAAVFDPVEFIKRFEIGMSYTAVQNALPDKVDQDILSYVEPEQAFLLNVEIRDPEDWSVSFRFDTFEAPLKRPEQLIEVSCSALVSSRSDSFESVVRRVTSEFGEPIVVDRSNRIQQAGWRVAAGSLLTVEYSVIGTPVNGKDVSIDFIVKRSRRQKSTPSRLIA